MLADEVDYVIGVDTHRDQHTLAVVAAPTGAVVAQTVGASERTRLRGRALRFADEHAPGVRVWAVEGAGHYGAGLTRYLSERGETVLEVGRTTPRRAAAARQRRPARRDPRRARRARGRDTRACRASGQRQEALRVLLLARRSAVDVRRVALVQLRSVIVTAPEQLRDELRRLPVGELLDRCSRFRRSQLAHTRRARDRARAALARAPDRSRDRRKPTSSSARSSATSARSYPNCSTSPASARSSPRN